MWTCEIRNHSVSVIDLLLLVSLLSMFLVLIVNFFSFTLDDAFITLRYSKHMAAGNGIVWNIGEDPVEGYTSTFWMFLGTVPHLLGFNAIVFLKVAGVIATIILLISLFAYGKILSVTHYVLVPVCAVVAASPAVAVISVQGMETTTAMVFVFLSAVATVSLVREFQRRYVFVLYITLFLSMLTRPGLVFYAGFTLLALFLITDRHHGRNQAMYLFVSGIFGLLLPGIVFMLTRYAYFGYWLPNSFYIKSGGVLFEMGRLELVFEFLTLLAVPAFIVGVLFAVQQSKPALKESMTCVAPLLAGTAAFLSLWLFIEPIQGFLWRFQLPVLPVILVSALEFAHESKPSTDTSDVLNSQILLGESQLSQAIMVLLVVLLVVFPIHVLDDAQTATSKRDQTARVVVGNQLNEWNENNYTMFVTESGAVPYYSEWTAIDWLGLNSEYIAHNGRDQRIIGRYDPDLIMILIRRGGSIQNKRPEVVKYIQRHDYRTATVVQREGGSNAYYVFFVDAKSDGYKKVLCSLFSLEDVEQKEPKSFEQLRSLDVDVARPESTCAQSALLGRQ